MVARLVSMVCGVVFTGLLSRYIGVEKFGQYSYALSLATLLAGIVAFGLDTRAIRELAQAPHRSAAILGRSLFIQIAAAALSLCGLAVYVLWYKQGEHSLWLILLVAAYTFLDTLGVLVVSLFRAREQMQYEAAAIIIGNVAIVGAVLLGIELELKLTGLLVLVAATYVVKILTILALAHYKCELNHLWRELRPEMASLKAGVPFFVTSIGNTIYATFPRLVVAAGSTLAAVGLYAAAERVVALIAVFVGIVDVVIYPIFAKRIEVSRDAFARTYLQVADFGLAGGLLIGLAVSAVLPEAVLLIFGREYRGAVSIAMLLAPSVAMMTSGYINGRAMLALRKESLMSAMIIAAAFVGIVFAVLLVRPFGAAGVAMSYLLTNAFGYLFYFIYLRRKLSLPYLNPRYVLFFALFPVAFVASYVSRDLSLVPRLFIHGCLVGTLFMVFRLLGLVDHNTLVSVIRAFTAPLGKLRIAPGDIATPP
jgi:O-antigen/teichoic acid export membrane protein